MSAERVAQYTEDPENTTMSVTIATQEPKDFAGKDILVHGKAIFNNSVYKMISHLGATGPTI